MNTTIVPRRLTGAALELAAGRMRHPDLPNLERQWLAAEQVDKPNCPDWTVAPKAKPTNFGNSEVAPDPMPTNWTESETARRKLVESGVTVVANLRSDAALIDWAQSAGLFVRVDRRSKWGNPYPMAREAERDAVCAHHAEWLKTQPGLLAAVGELKGRVLGCWCHPKRCHADHLAKLANGTDDGFKQQELFDD